MEIVKLVLHKYKRLKSTNIDFFEWTPKARIMFLLGSNGSGKSSVLEELTPCPASHSEFDKGGCKEFHCRMNNSVYVLKSVYNTGTGLHSFKKDDIELNEGGTFGVQKDLVKQHFRLDRNIHEVLTGVLPFTAMSVSKRKEWLTKISPVDLTYAIEQYNLVSTAKRDAQGFIRHKAKRISSENIDLPTDNEMQMYRQQVTSLSERLQELYRLRGSEPVKPLIIKDYKQELEVYRRKVKALLTDRRNVDELQNFSSEEQAVIKLHMLQQDLRNNGDQIIEIGHEIEELSSKNADTLHFTEEEVEYVKHQYETLMSQVKEARDKILPSITLPICSVGINANSVIKLNELYTELKSIVDRIPSNKDGYFSPGKAAEVRDNIKSLRIAISNARGTYDSTLRMLSRQKTCPTVTCPKCSHDFKPGIDPEDFANSEKKVHLLADQIESYEKELVKLTEYLEAYDDYAVYVNRYRHLVDSYPEYNEFWNVLSSLKVIFRDPRSITIELANWFEVQAHKIYLEECESNLQDVNQKLVQIQLYNNDENSYVLRRKQELEKQLTKLYDNKLGISNEIQSLKKLIESNRTYLGQIKTLENEVKAFIQNAYSDVTNLTYSGIDEEIKRVSASLTDIQAKLHKFELMEHTLRDIQKEHEEAVAWFNDLTVLEKSLSPKEGLIGRYMMGFMHEFFKLMNSAINDIWTYPLEVMPAKATKEDIDYNFPLNVNNGAVIAPDISRGSNSQRDVVNFAFKLVVMMFLDMKDYPLYLDEFGNTFDEQHRENLVPFLNRLVDSNQISQIVFISHFNSTHGSFTNAEVTVIDPTNITTPEVYNRTVTIR